MLRYQEQYFAHILSKLTTPPQGESSLFKAVKNDGVGCGSKCLRGNMSQHVQFNLPVLDDCLRGAPTTRSRVKCLESQQIIGWSVYGTMANNWLQHFPLSQLMLINSSALAVNTLSILRKVEDFLGLQHAYYPAELINTAFNTATTYGWKEGAKKSGGSDQNKSCDETCEAASQLGPLEMKCLTDFYQAQSFVFDPASQFYASGLDYCVGEDCTFLPIVPRPSVGVFNASTCLAAKSNVGTIVDAVTCSAPTLDANTPSSKSHHAGTPPTPAPPHACTPPRLHPTMPAPHHACTPLAPTTAPCEWDAHAHSQ